MIIEMQAVADTLDSAVPWDVFAYAGPITKLTMLISLIAAGAGLMLAIMRRASKGRHSGLLSGLGLTGLLFGVLGALYTGTMSYMAAKATQTTNLIVVLPSIIEAVYAFLFGLVAWLIARWGNAGAKRT
jgi:hypothetical protein